MKALTKREEIGAGIVEMIVRDLENGTCPWERPFGGASLPVNASTGKTYRGINVLILWGEVMRRGFEVSRWLTYHQAQQVGGYVRRGECGVPVVFYSPLRVPNKDADGKVRIGKDGKEETKVIRMVKYYTVFNVAQCGGVDSLVKVPEPSFVPVEEAERVMKATGAHIQYADAGKAFYEHTEDRVVLPPRSKFTGLEGFYGVAFHELAHWTGASSRLGRHQDKAVKGTPEYAFEELVAEMGAAFVCAHLGLPYNNQHATYIESWLRGLKDDPKVLFKAAAKAQEAADYILGITYPESDNGEGG